MESMVSIVNLIFKDVSYRKILSGTVHYACFPKGEFIALLNHKSDCMSGNDVEQMYLYLITMLNDQGGGRETYIFEKNGFSVLDVLRSYVDKVLEQIQGEPVCKYRRLLAWRMVTSKLCEDTFTTAFLAIQDLEKLWSGRNNFDWRTVIGHNNHELNNMLKKGVVENHYHLKGSAPYFAITWLNLMNDISNVRFIKCLREFDEHRLAKEVHYSWENGHVSSYVDMHLQAALIRCFLFCRLRKIPFTVFECFQVSWKQMEDYFDWPDNKQVIDHEVKEALKDFEKRGFCKVRFGELIRALLNKLQLPVKDKEFWKAVAYIVSDEFTVNVSDIDTKKDITLKKLLLIFIELGASTNISYRSIKRLVRLEYQEQFIKQKEMEMVNYYLSNPDRIFEIRNELQMFIVSFPVRFALRSEKVFNDQESSYDYIENAFRGNNDAGFKNVNRTERWFLYNMFLKLYGGDNEISMLGNMFYAYLIIKEKIRSELVQVNGKTGFDNFLKIQDRKEYFIDHTRFESIYSYIALADTWYYQRDSLIRLEARISPKDTAVDNRNAILKLEKSLRKIRNGWGRTFFVFHFVKEADKELISGKYQCRNYKKRVEVRKKAIAIENFRQRYPEQAKWVYGIDACSPEIGCRPEVFAQAFTFLRGMQEGADRHRSVVPRLGISYHVGEDFLDIVDGLRAIDEAIHFLHMDSGDRLGHALALGVSPIEWYEFKGRHVLLTKQDHLDNIVWVYMKIRKYHIHHSESMLQELYRDFTHCFQEIYGVSGCDINVYYDAWKLRGDDPEVCLSDKIDADTEWGYFARNDCYPENKKIRSQDMCVKLYHMYHYDKKVKRKGAEVIECKVGREFMEIIEQIQRGLQKDVAKLGISIEVNPSSNYMIGTFSRYDQHPIRNFYNKGLTVKYEEILDNPQIDVTINTDDQAIFNTCLENEYAYIALAMEKMRDGTGEYVYKRSMIYEWLDNIRMNGEKVCFWNNMNHGEMEE